MSRHTASRFMNVADAYDGKSSIVQHLDATALYALAAPSTPESVRTAVEELLVDGEKVTVADIKKMKADAKSFTEASA